MSGNYLPLAAARSDAVQMIFLCAMVPVPGLSMIDQFMREGTGMITVPFDETTPGEDGRDVIDPEVAIRCFYHDCSEELQQWALSRLRFQAQTIGTEPFPENGWPDDVPASYVLCREDQAVSPAWSRRVAQERLGTQAVELNGGHSPFFSRPKELARELAALTEA
jgi:pimeloyl-ACP methyl ester carboxylesterase